MPVLGIGNRGGGGGGTVESAAREVTADITTLAGGEMLPHTLTFDTSGATGTIDLDLPAGVEAYKRVLVTVRPSARTAGADALQNGDAQVLELESGGNSRVIPLQYVDDLAGEAGTHNAHGFIAYTNIIVGTSTFAVGVSPAGGDYTSLTVRYRVSDYDSANGDNIWGDIQTVELTAGASATTVTAVATTSTGSARDVEYTLRYNEGADNLVITRATSSPDITNSGRLEIRSVVGNYTRTIGVTRTVNLGLGLNSNDIDWAILNFNDAEVNPYIVITALQGVYDTVGLRAADIAGLLSDPEVNGDQLSFAVKGASTRAAVTLPAGSGSTTSGPVYYLPPASVAHNPLPADNNRYAVTLPSGVSPATEGLTLIFFSPVASSVNPILDLNDTHEFVMRRNDDSGIANNDFGANELLVVNIASNPDGTRYARIVNIQPTVTTTSHGLMRSTDKAKLDGIEAGATAGGSGTVSLTTALLDAAFDIHAGSISAGADHVLMRDASSGGNYIRRVYRDLPAATTSNAGLMSSADKTKLDGVETSATRDQTAGQIKQLYEANSNTNAFTDADHTKLDGIEAGATADQTNAEIKAAYEANSNTNAFTDADHTKLDGIEAGATADQTNAEIKAAYEANTNTNAFTDADHAKLDGIEAGATADQTGNEIAAALDTEIGNADWRSGGGSGSTPANASFITRGIVELATDAETANGTDSVRAATPRGVANLLAATDPSVVPYFRRSSTAVAIPTGSAANSDAFPAVASWTTNPNQLTGNDQMYASLCTRRLVRTGWWEFTFGAPFPIASPSGMVAGAASTTQAGIVRLANENETTAGSASTIAVTPLGLRQALDAADITSYPLFRRAPSRPPQPEAVSGLFVSSFTPIGWVTLPELDTQPFQLWEIICTRTDIRNGSFSFEYSSPIQIANPTDPTATRAGWETNLIAGVGELADSEAASVDLTFTEDPLLYDEIEILFRPVVSGTSQADYTYGSTSPTSAIDRADLFALEVTDVGVGGDVRTGNKGLGFTFGRTEAVGSLNGLIHKTANALVYRIGTTGAASGRGRYHIQGVHGRRRISAPLDAPVVQEANFNISATFTFYRPESGSFQLADHSGLMGLQVEDNEITIIDIGAIRGLTPSLPGVFNFGDVDRFISVYLTEGSSFGVLYLGRDADGNILVGGTNTTVDPMPLKLRRLQGDGSATVQYDRVQTLTTAQQAQARANIRAAELGRDTAQFITPGVSGFITSRTIYQTFSFSFSEATAGNPEGNSDDPQLLDFGTELSTTVAGSFLTLEFEFGGNGSGAQLYIERQDGSVYTVADIGTDSISPSSAGMHRVRLHTSDATLSGGTYTWRLVIGADGAAETGDIAVSGTIAYPSRLPAHPNVWRRVFDNGPAGLPIPYRETGYDTARELISLDYPLSRWDFSFVALSIDLQDLNVSPSIPQREYILRMDEVYANRVLVTSGNVAPISNPHIYFMYSDVSDQGAAHFRFSSSMDGRGIGLQFIAADGDMPENITHIAFVKAQAWPPYSRGRLNGIWGI